MSLYMSIAAMVVATSSLISSEVSHFPGSYFDAQAKIKLQRRAMEKWPGPSQIVGLWQSGELDRREKMAVLLGASASHDPVLLPLYREAVMSENVRLRMAAAYGYRDLLGDLLPDMADGVDIKAAEQLANEMDLVAGTLRERPLVEFWLQGALMSEGASMPGWRGVALRRQTRTCLRAVEKILGFDDFHYLATAYRIAEEKATRFSLMRLLESITLQEFFVKPAGVRAGWGTNEIDDALNAADAFVDYWVDVQCTTDPDRFLSDSLSTMGAHDVQPFAPTSYYFWLQVLKRGRVPWRMMAARRLYEFGGRWSQLTVFQADSPEQVKVLDGLIAWYRLLPAHILNRTDPKPPPQP